MKDIIHLGVMIMCSAVLAICFTFFMMSIPLILKGTLTSLQSIQIQESFSLDFIFGGLFLINHYMWNPKQEITV